MKWNLDYYGMFKTLNTAGARYLIVGAHAVGFHVEPRTTKDLEGAQALEEAGVELRHKT